MIDWEVIEDERRPGWFHVNARRGEYVAWGYGKDIEKAKARASARLRATERGE